jgi:hypothetical protein
MNAYEEGDLVHLDICLSDTNAFSFMREAGGVQRAQHEIQGGLTRWTFNMSQPGEGFDPASLALRAICRACPIPIRGGCIARAGI